VQRNLEGPLAELATYAAARGEKLPEIPKFLEKIQVIVEKEHGTLDRWFAMMGPWEFFTIVKFPDNEAAFRALGKIGALEYLKTETFPVEEVDVFVKAFV
jgi:uncharacterized protein with GYD domain